MTNHTNKLYEAEFINKRLQTINLITDFGKNSFIEFVQLLNEALETDYYSISDIKLMLKISMIHMIHNFIFMRKMNTMEIN